MLPARASRLACLGAPLHLQILCYFSAVLYTTTMRISSLALFLLSAAWATFLTAEAQGDNLGGSRRVLSVHNV